MIDELVWRPAVGGLVALTDAQLAQIGLMVVFEAGAKASASSALKVVEQLSRESWIKLERMQFSQIMVRLIDAAKGKDAELEDRIQILERQRKVVQESRHMIVHLSWGEGTESEPIGFDYGRQRLLTTADITDALTGCAELKRAAHWTAYRCAELIELGAFGEGDANGQGVGIRTKTRLVHL